MDTIKDGRPILEDIFKNYPELTELKKLSSKIIKHIDDPVILSDIALKMAGYLVRIGSLVSELSAQANEGYVIRKWRVLGEYHRMAGTVKDREAQSMENTIDEHKAELVRKYVYDIVKAYYDDHARQIQVIQSRLKVLQNESFT